MNTFTLHLEFKPLNGNPYPYKVTYEDANMNTFLAKRQAIRDSMVEILVNLKAIFIIEQNDDTTLKIIVKESTSNSKDFLTLVAMLQSESVKHPIKLTSRLYRDEDLQTVGLDIAKYTSVYPVTYTHVFTHMASRTYYVYYTDNAVPVPTASLDVNDVLTSQMTDGITITYSVNTEESIYKAMEYVTSIENANRTLENIPYITQDLTEQRLSELSEDILLKENLLYKFNETDPHALRVVEHSILRLEKPYIMVRDIHDKTDTVYVYIGDSVLSVVDTYKNVVRNERVLTVVPIYQSDAGGLLVQGYGFTSTDVTNSGHIEALLRLIVSATL